MTTLQIMKNAKAATQSLMLCDETKKNEILEAMAQSLLDHEKDILNAGFDVSADVIKLGHHGSKTSSSEVFLKSVNPTLAIISCGVNNQYNLPSEKILDMLDKLGIQYKRTDVSGTIVVGSDGEHIYVSTEK